MQPDPVLEWQRLTAEYRQKSPEELLELARDFADLTETAQQVLRGEMRSRGMEDPESPGSATKPHPARIDPAHAPLALRNTRCDGGTTADIEYGPFVAFGGIAPELVPDTPESRDEAEGPHEYTWKTVLCECETTEQARLLSEALQKSGIDSWIDHPGSTYRYRGSAVEYPRILVAADQLDQARAIAANPIPQEIVDQAKEEAPEFVEPKCPKCGSDDVVLEGVDPENIWRCEQCEERWTESMPKAGVDAPGTAQKTL